MASPSYTYTLTNGTSADASQVMQNFTDVLNGITDGTKDISVSALTVAGVATLNGNVILGSASSDDLTVNAALASSIPVKTTFSYDLGANATGLKYIFLGSADSAARSTKLAGATIASAYTFTLPVDGGTSRYVLETNGSGTTSWVPVRLSSTDATNVGISCSVSGNALTVALKGSDGNDPSSSNPVDIIFRSTTATTGSVLKATVTSAVTVTVSSGSTLGHKSATDHYIYVYALYQSSSSAELIVTSTLLDEGSLQSTTSEGGAGGADSIYGVYSTTTRSNVPVRLLARLKSNQTVAGTWAAVPTEVSLAPFGKRKAYLAAVASTTNITNNNNTDVVFSSVQIDNYNSYNTSTGIYTVPYTGIAKISAAIKLEMTGTDWTGGENLRVIIVHSSAGDIRVGEWVYPGGTNDVDPWVTASAIYPVTAGDTIKIKAYQNSGNNYSLTSSSSSLYNYFQLEIEPYAL